MRLLLDTLTLLWARTEPEKLSSRAAALIEDANNELLVSAITVVELSIKIRLGKLPEVGGTVGYFLNAVLADFGARELPFTASHGAEVEQLPRHHRDPFDLMLIAQSRLEAIPLVTNDREIARYDLEVIW